MTLDEMKTIIVERMQHDDYVSFVELRDAIGKSSAGDVALHLPGHDNLILWSGMSEDFAQAMIDLLSPDGPLTVQATTRLVYLADGAHVKLPIAGQIRYYKTPHWVPVTIRTKAKVAAAASKRKERP